MKVWVPNKTMLTNRLQTALTYAQKFAHSIHARRPSSAVADLLR
jgi:hypothetical protein